jgi:hypothetical protein
MVGILLGTLGQRGTPGTGVTRDKVLSDHEAGW